MEIEMGMEVEAGKGIGPQQVIDDIVKELDKVNFLT